MDNESTDGAPSTASAESYLVLPSFSCYFFFRGANAAACRWIETRITNADGPITSRVDCNLADSIPLIRFRFQCLPSFFFVCPLRPRPCSQSCRFFFLNRFTSSSLLSWRSRVFFYYFQFLAPLSVSFVFRFEMFPWRHCVCVCVCVCVAAGVRTLARP